MECASGISGDMTVAALLDLGADQEALGKAIESLPVEGFTIDISRVKKSGLDACDFLVRLDAEHENHDHDMEYLHGSTKNHSHPHGSEEGHDHCHGAGAHEHGSEEEHHSHHSHCHEAVEHHHDGAAEHHSHHGHFHESVEHHHGGDAEHHSHHGPAHVHRGLDEILGMIGRAALTDRAKDTAGRIFTILAEAEAKAHGVPLDQVHFHEVGAVDSIVDIVAAAVCLDNLDITEVIIPRLCEGQGVVRCQHGVIPVPVPAVVNIAQANGLPLHLTATEGELVTPTGAAIAAAVRTAQELPESFTIKKTGTGAGKRNYDRPSLLRAMLIERTKKRTGDVVCRLETNIDDCTGESLGYVMERLFEAGARDVHYTPIYMKKKRPAYQLNVICDKESLPELEQIIFRETTTIGIRRIEMERTVLERSEMKARTSLGEAEVKVCTLPDGEKRYYPEYSAVERLAKEHQMSYQEVYEIIKREASQ